MVDVGTVIIHCQATADDSMVKDERKKLVAAINAKDAKALQMALETAKDIKGLDEIVADAKQLLQQIHKEMEAEGKEVERWVSSTENSTQHIKVLSVAHPHAILDDLSYKLCKDRRAGRQ